MAVIANYLALIKFRLLSLVLVSTCMGYFIGADSTTPLAALFYSLLGTALVGGGANTLNQWKERGNDALMYRTRARPLPAERVYPLSALWFGIAISQLGFLVLALSMPWFSALRLLQRTPSGVDLSLGRTWLTVANALGAVAQFGVAIGLVAGLCRAVAPDGIEIPGLTVAVSAIVASLVLSALQLPLLRHAYRRRVDLIRPV